MRIWIWRKTIIPLRKKKFTKKERIEFYREEEYRDLLMMPEPLVEVPPDFEENWCLIPLPLGGRRSIVVASDSKTHSRLRNGKVLGYFKSYLPGGGVKRHTNKEFCILDCILHEPSFTYYVLDIMCWRGNYYFDCPADFRFFWLNSKFSEMDNLDKITKNNPFRFIPLPRYPCSKQNLLTLPTVEMPFEKEGVLFYHKEGHYYCAETPLMCYLSWNDYMNLLLPGINNSMNV